jgi:hypothetical protein
MKKLITPLGIFALLVCFTGCSVFNIASGKGTMRYATFEGGFYYIESDKGENYDLTNDEDYPSFQKDGLQVSFTVKTLGTKDAIHNWGAEQAVIISIEEL